jgi:hypothetical protein
MFRKPKATTSGVAKQKGRGPFGKGTIAAEKKRRYVDTNT